MAEIIQLKGNVQYQITLDPGVWIFDDRKKRIDEFFEKKDHDDELLTYQKQVGKQWDRELKEGAAIPTEKSEKAFVYKKDISGDWGIPFAPFLNNSNPGENVTKVIFHIEDGNTVEIDWKEALEGILWFAVDGKPIRENGPIYFLYGDGRNRMSPIKGIKAIELV